MRKRGTDGGDRRVRRTRAALGDALTRLMIARGYDALSVADICAEADVGRSAFYLHFAGKDNLLRSGFAQLEADLDFGSSPDGVEEIANRFFAHAARHRPLYRMLMRSTAAPVARTEIQRGLKPRIAACLSKAPSTAPVELRAVLTIDMMLELTHWWFSREPEFPPEEISRLFSTFARGLTEPGAGV